MREMNDVELDRVASRLRAVGQVDPSAAGVERIRLALLRPVRPSEPARGFWPRPATWRRPAYALAFAVALLTLGSTSVFASGDALPDSPLYAVRSLHEGLQVKLSGSPADRAALYAHFASIRTVQLRQFARDGGATRPGVVATLLHDISDELHHANQEAHQDGPGARNGVNQVDQQIGQQLTQLQHDGTLGADDNASLSRTIENVQTGQSGDQGTVDGGSTGDGAN